MKPPRPLAGEGGGEGEGRRTIPIAAQSCHGGKDQMLAAAAAPVFGAVTGLTAIDGPSQLWWCLPALAVMAAEAA